MLFLAACSLFILYPVLTHASYLQSAPEKFQNSTVLSPGNFEMFWHFDGQCMWFKLVVKTKGYVGFGLSPRGKMPDADIIVGGVRDNGETYLYDRIAIGNFMPLADIQADWFLDTATETETHTSLTFWRFLDTEDPDDLIIHPGNMNILWAYHETQDAASKFGFYKHTHHDTTRLELLSFPNSEVLDKDGKYELSWWYDGEYYMYFRAKVETLGWVGFGISKNGLMPWSDVVVGGMLDGEAYFWDRYAFGNYYAMPQLDEYQDWTLLSSQQSDTHTTLIFRRPLDTCDVTEDIVIGNGKIPVIWSYHDSKDAESADKFPQHTARGTVFLKLLDSDVDATDYC